MTKAGTRDSLESHSGINSPVPYILGTNSTPTTAENHDTWETVAQATDKLVSINSRIAAFPDELEVLSGEGDRNSEFLTAHKALLSPIRRMPPELMSEIFIHCLPVDDFLRPRPKDAPLLVSQICSLWRCIALSTPSLWCSLSVEATSLARSRSLATGMRVWLARSGACPLSLSLQEYYTPAESKSEVSRCFEVVISYLSRCRKLDLALSAASSYAVIPLMTLPILEYVGIWAEDSSAPLGRSICEIFAGAPRLQSLMWHTAMLPHHSCFPWSQLVDVTLCDIISVGQCLEFLRHCQALTTCTVEWFDDTSTTESQVPHSLIVRLPRLCTMNVCMTYEDDKDVFLDHLILPVLRHFDCSGLQLSSSVTNLLVRSGCQLETLCLRLESMGSFFLSMENFRTLFAHMSSLVLLYIDTRRTNFDPWEDEAFTSFDRWNDEVFMSLTSRLSYDGAQPSCLVPKLETLSIHVQVATFPSDEVVKGMLRSRLPSFRIDEDDSAMQPSPAVASLKDAYVCFWGRKSLPTFRKWFVKDIGDGVGKLLDE